MPKWPRNCVFMLVTAVATWHDAGTVDAAFSHASDPAIKLPLGKGDDLLAGHKRYREDDFDDEEFDGPPPEDYEPLPHRSYRYVPPPATYVDPRDFDWMPPPRPASCGKYRYWNGAFCVDARYRPPYVGPRW